MPSPEFALVSSYDYRLVALSIAIAVLASYAALDVAGRVTSARGGTERIRFCLRARDRIRDSGGLLPVWRRGVIRIASRKPTCALLMSLNR